MRAMEEEAMATPLEPRTTTPKIEFDMCRRLHDDYSSNLALTEHLHGLVSDHPDFEVLTEPGLDLYCFRYVPNGIAERQEEVEVQELLDCLNQEVVKAVQSSGLSTVMAIHVHGRVAIRMSSFSHNNLPNDVDLIFETIARWGWRLSKNYPFVIGRQ
jgi:glutamate/tyrosine decarboxylase-like PLP-dependent enzyme